mmetsp:Transcript_6996/g.13701  ORF Transcript_6996/g.13701 Transcript_6996/m.13701 type:complete len:204 (+) Transcript_6996:450-1061(+)
MREKSLSAVVLLAVEDDPLFFVCGECIVMVVGLVLYRLVVLLEGSNKLIPLVGRDLEIRVDRHSGILARLHVVVGKAVLVEDKHLRVDILGKVLQLLQFFSRAMDFQLNVVTQVPHRSSDSRSVVNVLLQAFRTVVTLTVVYNTLFLVDREAVVKAVCLLVHASVEVTEGSFEVVHLTLFDVEVGVDRYPCIFGPCPCGEATA